MARTARKGCLDCARDKTLESKVLCWTGLMGKVKITLPWVKRGSYRSKPPSSCGDACVQGTSCHRCVSGKRSCKEVHIW